MLIASGNYTGNGSARSITGVGFSPKILLIKGNSTDIGVFRTDTMATDSAKPFGGATALTTGIITSLDSDGFSLGTSANVNANGTNYYWVAFAHDGANNDIETGTYSGTAVDNKNISLAVITGTPNMVWIGSATTERAYFRTSDFSGDLAQDFGGGAQALNNIIQSFGAGTFQVGNRASTVNTNTIVYHYAAFVNFAGYFKVLTYAGDGSDNRSITGAGFAPDNAFTKRGNSTNGMVFRPKAGSAETDSVRLDGVTAFTTDNIQALESDGFQVGTSANVNIATSTPPYYAWVVKDIGPVRITVTTTLAKVTANINVDQQLPPLLSIGTSLAKVQANLNVSQRQEQAIVTTLVKVRASIGVVGPTEPNEVWVETWDEQDP